MDGHSFPRLSANRSFHGLFGWNSVLRIIFFSSEMSVNWLFLREFLWNMLCLLPRQLTSIKCSQKNTKNCLKKFQKHPPFWHFMNETSQQHYFILPKKSVKRTVCRQSRKTMWTALYDYNVWMFCYLPQSK